MPAYNFKPEFAEAVRTGRKCQTIRKTRKGAHVGGRAVLYTGQRTKACEKLGEGIIILMGSIELGRTSHGKPYASLYGLRRMTAQRIDALAAADGFDSAERMIAWFEKQYGPMPFFGFVHMWRLK